MESLPWCWEWETQSFVQRWDNNHCPGHRKAASGTWKVAKDIVLAFTQNLSRQWDYNKCFVYQYSFISTGAVVGLRNEKRSKSSRTLATGSWWFISRSALSPFFNTIPTCPTLQYLLIKASEKNLVNSEAHLGQGRVFYTHSDGLKQGLSGSCSHWKSTTWSLALKPELVLVADDNLGKGGETEVGGRRLQRGCHCRLLVVRENPAKYIKVRGTESAICRVSNFTLFVVNLLSMSLSLPLSHIRLLCVCVRWVKTLPTNEPTDEQGISSIEYKMSVQRVKVWNNMRRV